MTQEATAQLVAQLQSGLKTAHLRAVFLFQCSLMGGGDTAPADSHTHATSSLTANIQQLSQGYTNQLSLGSASGVAEPIPIHRYRDYLGATYAFVHLHFDHDLNYDALAAVAGTLAGGGILCITLPVGAAELKPSLQRLHSHANEFPLVQAVTSEQGFIDALRQMLHDLSEKPAPTTTAIAYPTLAQQRIIDALLAALPQEQRQQPCVPQLLLADRGRGKSTCAGLAVNAALPSGRRFLVTAPRKSSAMTLIQAAGGESAQVRFVAWDKLLSSKQKTPDEYLLIDEAGAIPQHILQQLLSRFQVWVITTTVDGYEGAGRGFAIRLQRQLEEQYATKSHQLTQPLRWHATDQLEPWLKQALLMQSAATPADDCKVVLSDTPPPPADTMIHETHASELDPAALESVFKLLTDAHYQTSPNDLKLLLDDPKQRLLLVYQHTTCTAVAWLSHEGPLSADLHTAITRGERRPAGNLLPQSLAYFSQCEAALNHAWLRVVRIAVKTSHRRQHLGTQLLTRAYEIAQGTGCVGLGTVFGGDDTLLRFWQASGFQLLRQSSKINMASGYAAVTMVKFIDPNPQPDLAILDAAQTFAAQERQWRQSRVLPSTIPADSQFFSQHLVASFRAGILPFDVCHFALLIFAQGDCPVSFPKSLRTALEQPNTAAEVAKQGGYESQKALLKTLRSLLKNAF